VASSDGRAHTPQLNRQAACRVNRCLLFVGIATLSLAATIGATEGAEPAADLTLRVRVQSVEPTDLYPHDPCIDAGDCIPMHFWYKYRATVLENVSGNWLEPRIQFANLQHARYDKKLTRDWMVRLSPCPPSVSSALKVTYCVAEGAF
jgi:hypothetical protein